MESKPKAVFVTGGNSGIGFALCKQLSKEHNIRVFMGSRSVERGEQAVKEAESEGAKLELVHIDVSDKDSIAKAVEDLKEKLGEDTLWALVNNAGTSEPKNDLEAILAVNFYGVQNVTEAFLPLLEANVEANPSSGTRVVTVGSTTGQMFVKKVKTKEDKIVLTSDNTTTEQLKEMCVRDPHDVAKSILGMPMPYIWSKALVHVYVQIMAQKHQGKIGFYRICPGLVDTKLVKNVPNFVGKKKVEDGTVSIKHCLFNTDNET